jgi:hypothetical protein
MSPYRDSDIDLDRSLREWLIEGPTTLSDLAIDEALDAALRTRQDEARTAPWRYLTMTSRTIARQQRRLWPVAAAAAVLLLAAALGTYLVLRPDIGIGDPPPPTPAFDAADLEDVVDAPAALAGQLVVGTVPPDHMRFVDGSASEAVHLVLATSTLARSGQADDEARRQALSERYFTGLQSAETRFYDATGPAGEPLPVTEPDGSSFMVTAITYTDNDAAGAAFGALVEAYESWGFDGTEPWDHGDQSVAFTTTQMDRPHGRCYVLSSTEGCLQAMRTWRTGNMVVSVLAEGEGDVSVDDVVASVDAAAR